MLKKLSVVLLFTAAFGLAQNALADECCVRRPPAGQPWAAPLRTALNPQQAGSGSKPCYPMAYGCAFGPYGCAYGGDRPPPEQWACGPDDQDSYFV